MEPRIDKDSYFLNIARMVSKRSPCLNRHVGCILVDKNDQILSTGYNGPPRKVPHCLECTRNHSSRDLYSCAAVHAEMNALLQCHDIERIVRAYVTINPCSVCMRLLANTPVQEIIIIEPYTEESLKEFIEFWEVKLGRVLAMPGRVLPMPDVRKTILPKV